MLKIINNISRYCPLCRQRCWKHCRLDTTLFGSAIGMACIFHRLVPLQIIKYYLHYLSDDVVASNDSIQRSIYPSIFNPIKFKEYFFSITFALQTSLENIFWDTINRILFGSLDWNLLLVFQSRIYYLSNLNGSWKLELAL